ncbi:hypothetical protein BS467_07735 [Bacillus altitudinis]|nr:hypothetical protein BS467_07735 [Bacillus altitudinis]
MKYVIPYDHLKDELVTTAKLRWHFEKVRECANKHRLELSDEDFERFFRLHVYSRDIDWIMRLMNKHDRSFLDALVSYVTY